MGAREFLLDLLALGFRASIDNGRVYLEGPEGTATAEVFTVARTLRDDLLALVEDYEERAGIYEHDAGLDRAEAERQAWADVLASVATEAREAA